MDLVNSGGNNNRRAFCLWTQVRDAKGEFHLSNGGIALVVIAMVFFLVFVITRAIKSKD